jgi:hypothetical protein
VNNALFQAETSYPPEFEQARAAFHPVKTDSKCDAFKAYRQTEKQRSVAAAVGGTFIRCCELYSTWVDSENAKRRAQRQSDQPRLHMATFIRQRRWEAFMEEIKSAPAFAPVNLAGWEAEAAKIKREVSEEKFAAWFGGVQVKRGQPIELIFPSVFKAKYVAQHFPYALRRAFGECRLTSIGSQEKVDIGG